MTPETLIRSERGIASPVNSANLTGFHLHDGDRIRVEVTATNNVEASSTATSDGFTVDLTDPVMIKLVDGDSLDADLQYTVRVRSDKSNIIGPNIFPQQIVDQFFP